MVSDPAGTADPRYLAILDPDPDRASAKYFDLFRRLVKFFEWRNCHPAEELAQETLTRGLNSVAAGAEVYAVDPNQFFLGYARNIARECWKARQMGSLADIDEPASATGTAGQVEERILLSQCLALLPADERDLIVRYYAGDHRAVCLALGLSAGALRVRVHRIVDRLRNQVRARSGLM